MDKQWRKEFLEFCKYKNFNTKQMIQAYRFNKKFPNWCTPCEDCDNPYCTHKEGRVFWCPDNM